MGVIDAAQIGDKVTAVAVDGGDEDGLCGANPGYFAKKLATVWRRKARHAVCSHAWCVHAEKRLLCGMRAFVHVHVHVHVHLHVIVALEWQLQAMKERMLTVERPLLFVSMAVCRSISSRKKKGQVLGDSNMQLQRATCNMQRTTLHNAAHRPVINMQHATCNLQFAACTCNVTCNLHCNMPLSGACGYTRGHQGVYAPPSVDTL